MIWSFTSCWYYIFIDGIKFVVCKYMYSDFLVCCGFDCMKCTDT